MNLSSTRLASSPRIVYWSMAGFMIAVIGWAAFQTPLGAYFYGSDYWPHAAAIKEWSANLAHPGHPQIAGGQATSLFVPANLVVTLLAAAFNLSPMTAMGVAAILNLIILFGGIYAFSRVYFAHRWAPVLVLGVFTLAWGNALPWSGMIQAKGLLFVASYPSTQALGLAWGAIALAIAMMRSQIGAWWPYPALAALSTVILASHPLSGALLLISIGIAALTEESSWKLRAGTLGAATSALLLVEAWPWHSFWRIVTSRSGINEPVWEQFRDPTHMAVALGPLLLGIGAAWLLARRHEHPLIVLGLAVTTAVWAIDHVVSLPLGHRFLHFSGYFMGLALVALLLTEHSRRVTTAAWWAAGSAVALNVALVGLTLAGYMIWPVANATSFDWSTEPVVAEMRTLTAPLAANSVVLADQDFADPVAAFEGKVVAISSIAVDRLLSNGEELVADTELFLQTGTGPSIRKAIIARRSVTHVLFDSSAISLEEVAQHGRVVATAGDLVMVEIQR
ncbi:MAG: hypothetical protein OEM22_06210 [Acidimicrobiia bacterium]|nr:hypothetical protein [Acidimicrobiia bacterium]